MYVHSSSCLEGPITKSRPWWTPAEDAGVVETLDADADIRHDLVERVRGEIAAGVYDTPEKMDIAMDRLLRRLETA